MAAPIHDMGDGRFNDAVVFLIKQAVTEFH
jgi:hypothetical protein